MTSSAGPSPDQLFADLVEHFAGRDGITVPVAGARRGFGSTALRADGTIFAMLSRGLLTLKLPPERVRSLIEEGTGVPFAQTEQSPPWREWVALTGTDPVSWRRLAEEALGHVRG